MKIYKLLQQFLFFVLLCFTTISVAQSNSFEHLKDGQDAFNLGYYHQAFEIWHSQAVTGDADAQMFVGLAYKNGWGVPKELEQAIIWYKLAAEQQNTSAQFLLGLALLDSENQENISAGISWLEKAAANGDPKAYKFLAKAKQKNWFAGNDPLKVPAPKKAPSKATPVETQNSATVSGSTLKSEQIVSQVVLN